MLKIRGLAIVAALCALLRSAGSSAYCSCAPAPSTAQALVDAVEVVSGQVLGIALDSDENFVRLAVRVTGVYKGAGDGFQTLVAPRETDLQARVREEEEKAKSTRRAVAAVNAAGTLGEALGLLKNVPTHRALAFFRYDTGCWVWGFSYGYASQSRANARALTECQNQRGLQTDRACALASADGTKPPGADERACFSVEGQAER